MVLSGFPSPASATNKYCTFEPTGELYAKDYWKWMESGLTKCKDAEIIIFLPWENGKDFGPPIDKLAAAQLLLAGYLCDFTKTIAVFPSNYFACVLHKGPR
jgi:hypothetical protein